MRFGRFLFIGLAMSAGAAQAADAAMPDSNNSGINQRDRANQTLTPEDQSQSSSDIDLAAKIRRAVMDHDGLSMDGKNIKILTVNNAVTLRGPVKDISERAAIEQTVRLAAGSATVDNQLDIK